jgi:hypothetical protein
MLTIKHISESGHETIRETAKVQFVPASAQCIAPASDELWIDLENGSTLPLYSGTAYVMNRWGKTVSTYQLTSPEAAQGTLVAQFRQGSAARMNAPA